MNETPNIKKYEFFPDSPRVLYQISPLVEVVCQLSFPTVLRIEASLPADFQEDIRGSFPVFQRQNLNNFQQLPKEIVQMMGAANQQATTYLFQSEDGSRTITLTPNSLAFTCRNYKRREEFFSVFEKAKISLEKHYRPAFYNRIGLRYQNAVQPLAVGRDDEKWSYYLSNNILGELRDGAFGTSKVSEAHRIVRISAEEGKEGVLLQHGIGFMPPENKSVYFIDIDCYTSHKIETSHANTIFSQLNRRAGCAFRWCISDEYHVALKPTRLD